MLPRQELSLLLFVFGFSLFAAGFVGVEEFGASDFVKTGFPKFVSSFGGYNSFQFIGVTTAVIALPLSTTLITIASQISYSAFNGSVIVHFVVSLLSIALAWLMYDRWNAKDLFNCGLLLCSYFGSDLKENDTANGYFQLMAIPMCLYLIGLALAHLYFAVKKLLSKSDSMSLEDNDNLSLDTSVSTPLINTSPKAIPNGDSPRRVILAIIFTLFVILLSFVTSILIPNGWLNWTGHKLRVSAIEVVDAKSAFRDFKFGYVLRPEVPGAFFRTFTVSLGGKVIAKVFPDIYLFYGYLLVMFIMMRSFYKIEASIEMKIISTSFVSAIFLVCFIHSWWYHNWHGWWGGVEGFIASEPSVYGKLARTAGQVSSLLLGLLALPVGRHSPLCTALGTSWERSLFVHKFLGNAFLVVSFFHVACWWKVFSDENVLSHDALSGIFRSAPTFYPLNQHAKPGHCYGPTCLDPLYNVPASDNFTIPLMNFLGFYVIIPVFGLLTIERVRRNNYEWFYYLHSALALVVVSGVIWHAAASFVFIMPGLILIVVDRITRFIESATPRKIKEIRVSEDRKFVSLHIEPTIDFQPGQYVFINIPSISEFQFHPFSISSSSDLTVHAKIMSGDSTFTNALQKVTPASLVHVQGPFGKLPRFENRDAIIFIAGGIGITPIASILSSFFTRSHHSKKGRILLLWVARDGKALFDEFSGVVNSFRTASHSKVVLFDTNANNVDEQSVVISARPKIGEEVGKFLTSNDNDVLVFACGPKSLIKAAKDACFRYEFHEELFEL
jgi:NAD(P)H-flavin reductase